MRRGFNCCRSTVVARVTPRVLRLLNIRGAPLQAEWPHLNSLSPSGNSVLIAEIVEDALRRDSHALALERGVGVTGRLWSPLTNLRHTKGRQRNKNESRRWTGSKLYSYTLP